MELQELAKRKKITFLDLSDDEKTSLNNKEIIEDYFFIVLAHDDLEIERQIDRLCPLNFFVTEDLKLVAYNEDDATRELILPEDTKLIFNRI